MRLDGEDVVVSIAKVRETVPKNEYDEEDTDEPDEEDASEETDSPDDATGEDE